MSLQLTAIPLARLALNLKDHNYTTHFLLYPQISPVLSSPPLSLPARPSPPSIAPYTLPTARIAGTWVNDSLSIARALEAAYPDAPSLRLESQKDLIQTVESSIIKIATPLVPFFLPTVCKKLLPGPSAEYVKRTREPMLGKVEELEEKTTREGESMWEAAKGPGLELAGLVRSWWKKGKGKGPFFEGDEPGFADFIVVGFLWSTRRHGEEYFECIVEWDRQVFHGLWVSCEAWMEKVD
jgi:glutathione S-transferase